MRTIQTQAKIPVEAIKALRQRTGASIKAVKEALEATNGDVDNAIDHLRKLGASLAANRAHRQADDGLIAVSLSPDGHAGAMIELSSETDFVARTEQFSKLATNLAQSAVTIAQDGSKTGLLNSIPAQEVLSIDGGADRLAEAATALGEKIELRRAAILQVEGCVHGYVHRAVSEMCGKIGVLVALNGHDMGNLARRTALHVAAARPWYTSIDRIPEAHVQKEKSILLETAEAETRRSGKAKSESVLQRMVDGRLRKWFADVVLEEQEMLVEVDGYGGKPRSVAKSLRAEADSAEILDFVRYEVGNM